MFFIEVISGEMWCIESRVFPYEFYPHNVSTDIKCCNCVPLAIKLTAADEQKCS